MNNNRMTLLFCTCDKYKDLWNPFFTIMKNRWKDCAFPILLNTETERFDSDIFNISCLSLYKNNRHVSYGKRMIDHIHEIKTPYVMLVLDDFFLRENVNVDEIEKVINYMDDNPNVSSVRLTPYYDRDAYNNCVKVTDLDGYYWMPKYSGYKLNFQVCIWRTKKLLSYWREDDDPWRWEVFANITSFADDGFIIVGEDIGPILDYGYKVGGQPLSDIYRGKWVKENGIEQLFQEYGIDVKFENRGFYSPTTEKKHFRSFDTFVYVLKRIGLINTIILSSYILSNEVKNTFHCKARPLSEYPIAFKKYDECILGKIVRRK